MDDTMHAAQAGLPWEQKEIPKALQEPTYPKNLLCLSRPFANELSFTSGCLLW
jgi:hypothetical protein